MDILQLAKHSQQIQHIYSITPEVYYSFQRCSNDYNPLHTDEDFAKSKNFSERVMYGNILNCFVSHFVGMLLPVRNVILIAQDIQYHRPVYLYDEICMEAIVNNVSDTVNIIEYKLKFFKQMEEKKTIVAKGHVQVGLLKE